MKRGRDSVHSVSCTKQHKDNQAENNVCFSLSAST